MLQVSYCFFSLSDHVHNYFVFPSKVVKLYTAVTDGTINNMFSSSNRKRGLKGL